MVCADGNGAEIIHIELGNRNPGCRPCLKAQHDPFLKLEFEVATWYEVFVVIPLRTVGRPMTEARAMCFLPSWLCFLLTFSDAPK